MSLSSFHYIATDHYNRDCVTEICPMRLPIIPTSEKVRFLRVQVQYPPGGFPTVDGAAVGVGVGDETGAEVRRITGSELSEFPPELLTLPGTLLGPEEGFEQLADEINEEACSGERVVVVGGRVCGSGEVDGATRPGADDVPLIP